MEAHGYRRITHWNIVVDRLVICIAARRFYSTFRTPRRLLAQEHLYLVHKTII